MQNMMINNKKAVSDVVAVTLFILISIVAVSTVAVFVNQIVNPVSLSAKIDCADLQMKNAIKINSVCFNNNTKEVELFIERSLDSEFYSLDFSIGSESENLRFRCDSNCLNCRLLSNGESKKYFFAANGADFISIKSGNCVLASSNVKKC